MVYVPQNLVEEGFKKYSRVQGRGWHLYACGKQESNARSEFCCLMLGLVSARGCSRSIVGAFTVF